MCLLVQSFLNWFIFIVLISMFSSKLGTYSFVYIVAEKGLRERGEYRCSES